MQLIQRIGLGVGLILIYFLMRGLGHDAPYVTMTAALAGIVPALIARSKGRNFELWWAFGFFLPPIALLTAMLIDKGAIRSRALTVLGVILFGGQMLTLFCIAFSYIAFMKEPNYRIPVGSSGLHRKR